MRPSQYHYVKRMWTRNSYKKKRGCLGAIFHWIFIMMLFGACLYFIVWAGVFVLAIVGIVIIVAAIIYLIGKIVAFLIHKFKSNTSEEELFFPRLKTLEEEEAEESLNHIKELANIINTTTNEEEFERSLSQIKSELKILSSYEGRVPFKNSTPSEDLKRILDNESLTRKKFKARSNNIPNTINAKEKRKECITLKGLDPYTVDAGLLILKKDRAAIGVIQRAFDIGFNRANMIMQQLELLGVVGPENGTKPRKILMSIREFKNAIVLSNKYEDFSEYFDDNYFNNDGITPENLNEKFRSIEQYAVMCNAYLEREDEMEQYLDKTEE